MERSLSWLPKPKSDMAKLLGFLAVGLPAFAVAVPLNWFLVSYAGVSKPLAYAVVLVFQVTLNFFLCRWLIFSPGDHKSARRQFAEFVTGILGFRAGDWALYSILAGFFPSFYLGIQVFNVILFAALKYRFSRKVIEGK